MSDPNKETRQISMANEGSFVVPTVSPGTEGYLKPAENHEADLTHKLAGTPATPSKVAALDTVPENSVAHTQFDVLPPKNPAEPQDSMFGHYILAKKHKEEEELKNAA